VDVSARPSIMAESPSASSSAASVSAFFSWSSPSGGVVSGVDRGECFSWQPEAPHVYASFMRAPAVPLIAELILVTIAALGAAPVPHRRLESLRIEYAALRPALLAADDSQRSVPASGRQAAIARAWSVAAEWTAAALDAHPSASSAELAKAIEELDPALPCAKNDARCADAVYLRAEVVPLRVGVNAAWAVALAYPHAGTFFIVARRGDGRHTVAWNIHDLAARHLASRDEIGRWAWTGSSWGDGPLVGHIVPLRPSRFGNARFAVDAAAAPEAGGTFEHQIGVWEWDGRKAAPLLLRSYAASLDTPPNELAPSRLAIHTKGEFRSFSTCGACADPEVIWHFDVTPEGLVDRGTTNLSPELQACDQLWNAVIHHHNTAALAAPAVVATLQKLVAGMAMSDREHPLGMLLSSRVGGPKGHRILELSADNLPEGGLRFDLTERNGRLYFFSFFFSLSRSGSGLRQRSERRSFTTIVAIAGVRPSVFGPRPFDHTQLAELERLTLRLQSESIIPLTGQSGVNA
jgi:hypothetical protein